MVVGFRPDLSGDGVNRVADQMHMPPHRVVMRTDDDLVLFQPQAADHVVRSLNHLVIRRLLQLMPTEDQMVIWFDEPGQFFIVHPLLKEVVPPPAV